MSSNRKRITFFEVSPLSEVAIRLVQGSIGLYFIFLKDIQIPYPFQKSRLIYIGMSESKQNSIGSRLKAHKTGQSGNQGIVNYAKTNEVYFTFLESKLLKAIVAGRIQEQESLFLQNFLGLHGSYPICNNQSGITISKPLPTEGTFDVEWDFFQ